MIPFRVFNLHGKSAVTQMIIHIIISTTVTRTNCLGGKIQYGGLSIAVAFAMC